MAAAIPQALRAMESLGIEKTILLPPPLVSGHRGSYGMRDLEQVVREHPERFAFVAGGESLNPMIHDIPPDKVGPPEVEQFRAEAALIVAAGAAGFGEFAAEHFSSGRGNHPYESAPADHPLMLVLADIAAQHAMPIDLHMEAVPEDMKMPVRFWKGPNPERLRENISALERLLTHNRKALIVWVHAGWDLTGERTVALMRALLAKHPNLRMSIKLDPNAPRRTFPLASDESLRPGWLALLREFPERFVIGSDQFHDEGTGRLALARRLIGLLPPDLAPLVAGENARKIYRLNARAK